MKFGPFLLLAGVAFGIVDGIASLFVPQTPAQSSNASTTQIDAKVQQAIPTQIAAKTDRTWQSNYDGHVVECVVPANGYPYYIVMPDEEEAAAGAEPATNLAPSEDSWAASCGQEH